MNAIAPSSSSSSSPRASEPGSERRKKRSPDPLIALHYQLANARQDASLEAIVLADTSGVVVAGAGSWVICEELAAYAPILANAGEGSNLPSRMEALKGDLDVRTMHAAGQPMLLCALSSKGKLRPASTGRTARLEAAERCAAGVTRILETSL